MEQGARAQPGRPGQKRAAKIEGNAVQVVAQHRAAAHVTGAHQPERQQEVLAELLVSVPRRPVLMGLKGQGVDEDRAAAAELHVVCARVAQGEPASQREKLEVEREQGGVLELAEGPFVRVGDEGEAFRLEYRVGSRAGRELDPYLPMGHEQVRFDQLSVESRRDTGVERGRERLVDLPVEGPVSPEDEPAGVPKRAFLDAPRHGPKG